MPNILLCFTNNISLKNWEKSGNLSREVVYFNKSINKKFNYILLTYGDLKDKNIDLLYPFKVIPFYAILKRKNNRYLNYFFHIIRIFKISNILKQVDIIKSNQLIGSNVSILIGLIFRKKVIVRIGYEPNLTIRNEQEIPLEYRNNNFNKIFELQLYISSLFSYKFSNLIICTSKEQKIFIANKFKVQKSKIRVIPNWIDTKNFKPNIKNKEKKGILYVGRLEKEKNPELLLRSLININEKVTMIGTGSLKERLISISKTNSINLEILDPIPNIQLVDFYQKCKIFVQPSFYEGNPKTILEAMSCGCPVIAKNVIGIREIINNKNGLLVENEYDLRNAIEFLLNKECKRKELGENARRHIMLNNDIDLCFEKEMKLILELIG